MTQLELQKLIVEKSRVNVVTCGRCGVVMFHLLKEIELKCPECNFKGEPCEFPDYHY